MKGPAHSIRDSGDVTGPEVKVKRKCGRPRNPIPRHQRPSHIEAEQKRRVKIQDGLQTLKNFLPKDYQTPGRESKADILLNSVRYIVESEEDVQKQKEELEKLRAEAAALNAAITGFQENLPDEKLFDENPMSAEQRFDRLVAERTKENTKFSIFGYLTDPLHKKFEQMADCSTIGAFQATTRQWANEHLSRAKLRPMFTKQMQKLSKEKSFLDIPDQAPQEAKPPCRPGRKPKAAATITSADVSLPGAKRQLAASSSSSSNDIISSSKQQCVRRVPKAPGTTAGKRGKKSGSANSRTGLPPPSAALHVLVTTSQPDLSLLHPSSSSSSSFNSSSSTTSSDLVFTQDPEEAVHDDWQSWSSAAAAAAVKTEYFQPKAELRPSCSAQPVPVSSAPQPGATSCLDSSAAELPKVESMQWESGYRGEPAHRLQLKSVADSPLSTDSAISLSPPPSSTYESSLLGGDFLYESSMDQCYEPLTPAVPSVCQDFRQGQSGSPPLLDRGGELEEMAVTFDVSVFQSMVENCQETASAMYSDPSSALNVGLSSSDHMALLSDMDSSLLFSTDLPPSSVPVDPPCSNNSTELPSFISMVSSSSNHMDPPCLNSTDLPSFISMAPPSSGHMDIASCMNTDPPSFIDMVPSTSSHMDPPTLISMVSSSSSGNFDPSSLLTTPPSASAAVHRMDHSPALPYEALLHDFLQQDALQHDFLQQDALQHDFLQQDGSQHDALPHDALPHDALPHDGLQFEHLRFEPWQFDAWPSLGEW